MMQEPTKTLEEHLCGFLMRRYGTRVEADAVVLAASLATFLQPQTHQHMTWEAVWRQFDERTRRPPIEGKRMP